MEARTRRQPRKSELQRLVNKFNREFPVNTDCDLRTDSGKVRTHVIAPAQLLGGHSAVAWFDGVRGAYSIENERVSKVEAESKNAR